jgi:hypothetical protein
MVATSAYRELTYFMPLPNGFGFDIKTACEDVTSQIFPYKLFFTFTKFKLRDLQLVMHYLLSFHVAGRLQ